MVRIESVDVVRVIAILAVIAIHTGPFRDNPSFEVGIYKYLDIAINQFSRFAVPFFFILSGYFWGSKVRGGDDPLLSALFMAKRLLMIFAFWSLVYILPFQDVSGELFEFPWLIFMQGTKVHLWFLIGLLLAVLISSVFIKLEQTKALVLLSFLLYFFGVLSKSYSDSPMGIEFDFNTRNGPFFSCFLFVTGYLLSGLNPKEKWWVIGGGVFSLGLILQFIETFTLWLLFDTSPNQDYVFGTYFMGVGVAMISLSNHKVLKIRWVSKIGKLTLGVYAVHYVFVDLFKKFDLACSSVAWEVGYVAIVFVLSVLVTLMLSKIKLTRRFVV